MIGALLIAVAVHAGDGFTKVGDVDGITIESRPVEGSAFVELRLSGTTKAPPAAVCNAVYGNGKFDAEEPDLKSRAILKETADERVTHDLISPPVVSDREYTVRTVRALESPERCTVKIDSANELAPQVLAGRVQITKIHAQWLSERQSDGKTKVTYQIFSDPAGAVPPFLVEGARRTLAVKWLKMICARAEKAP